MVRDVDMAPDLAAETGWGMAAAWDTAVEVREPEASRRAAAASAPAADCSVTVPAAAAAPGHRAGCGLLSHGTSGGNCLDPSSGLGSGLGHKKHFAPCHASTVVATGQIQPAGQAVVSPSAQAQCGDPGCKIMGRHSHLANLAGKIRCHFCGGAGCGGCGGLGLGDPCSGCGGSGLFGGLGHGGAGRACGVCGGCGLGKHGLGQGGTGCGLCGGKGCANCLAGLANGAHGAAAKARAAEPACWLDTRPVPSRQVRLLRGPRRASATDPRLRALHCHDPISP